MGIKCAHGDFGRYSRSNICFCVCSAMLGIVMHELARFIDGQFYGFCGYALASVGNLRWQGCFRECAFKTDDTGDQVLEFCQSFGGRVGKNKIEFKSAFFWNDWAFTQIMRQNRGRNPAINHTHRFAYQCLAWSIAIYRVNKILVIGIMLKIMPTRPALKAEKRISWAMVSGIVVLPNLPHLL